MVRLSNGSRSASPYSLLRLTGMAGALAVSGCDYWPPALQAQIEELETDNARLLERQTEIQQRLTDTRRDNESLKSEAEDLARRNQQLAARLQQAEQGLRARAAAPSQKQPAVMTAKVRPTGRAVQSRRPAAGAPTRGKEVRRQIRLTWPNMTGPDVKRLQRLLRRRGLPVIADAIYGRDTRAAVMWYQRQHGLAEDGVVGPKTWTSLTK